MTDQEYLASVKHEQGNALIQHLNAVTAHSLMIYPAAEVETWPIQKLEAEKVTTAGDDAELDMAPFLTLVCQYHHGDSDDVSRLEQVKVKAAAVQANAQAWAQVAAFVNGIRARTQERIELAESIGEVLTIMNEMRLEVDAFRTAAGI